MIQTTVFIIIFCIQHILNFWTNTEHRKSSNMRKCSVLGCDAVKNNPKIPCFRVPANNIQAWNEVISKANKQITNVKFVCANHILPTDLISTYSVPQDIIEVSYKL